MHEALKAILDNIPELYNLCQDRIRPIAAQINTEDVSHATYKIEAQESTQNLDGPSSLQAYNIELTVYCPDVSALGVVMDAVKAELNGYRDVDQSGGLFQLVSFTGEQESTDQDETTFRTQQYSAWV